MTGEGSVPSLEPRPARRRIVDGAVVHEIETTLLDGRCELIDTGGAPFHIGWRRLDETIDLIVLTGYVAITCERGRTRLGVAERGSVPAGMKHQITAEGCFESYRIPTGAGLP